MIFGHIFAICHGSRLNYKGQVQTHVYIYQHIVVAVHNDLFPNVSSFLSSFLFSQLLDSFKITKIKSISLRPWYNLQALIDKKLDCFKSM